MLIIPGLKLTITHTANASDVWMHFTALDGKTCSLSIAALADKSGPIVGRALRSWASDRLDEGAVWPNGRTRPGCTPEEYSDATKGA